MAKYKEKDKAGGPVARNDAYVMMLFITFVCIVAGCVLMYMDNEEYGGKPPPKENVQPVPALGAADKTGAGTGAGTTTPGEPKAP
jgi:hypothetical protein